MTSAQTSSTATSTAPQFRQSLLDKGAKYLEGKGKLKLLTGMIAADSLASATKRAARNQDVEEQIALKALGGESVDVPSAAEVNEMGGGMHLGDVNHPQPQPIIIQSSPAAPAQQNSMLGTLGTMILGATLGGGGLALGQLLNRPAPVVQPAEPGETTDLGLGRIEDYLKGK